jgi:hypothetical protein
MIHIFERSNIEEPEKRFKCTRMTRMCSLRIIFHLSYGKVTALNINDVIRIVSRQPFISLQKYFLLTFLYACILQRELQEAESSREALYLWYRLPNVERKHHTLIEHFTEFCLSEVLLSPKYQIF